TAGISPVSFRLEAKGPKMIYMYSNSSKCGLIEPKFLENSSNSLHTFKSQEAMMTPEGDDAPRIRRVLLDP
ncbi:hypothetical protein ABEV00_19460, partial [Paenibacillus thiaminolyticus]|uniref:hypothetical protein n=1 Tax=Paenibacillus thiaminolyticus TaxID=49283 RepID=UPI003D28EFC2